MNQGTGMRFHRWEESGCETELGHAWRFTSFLSIYCHPMTLLRTKKPMTAFVFWPRLEIHVGSGQNLQVFFSFIHLFVSYSNKTQLIASHKARKTVLGYLHTYRDTVTTRATPQA